ncbi:MAG: hypothetical protein ACYTGP_08360 [Planctomycetota bacterium]
MRSVLTAITTCAILTACASPPPEPPPGWPVGGTQVEHTPMSIDPMDPQDLSGWWTDGAEMLRLDADGSYARYATTNRYVPPVERGQWTHDRYFEVHLTPYDARVRERTRIGLAMQRGTLTMRTPDGAELRWLPGPPPMPEDRLVGRWSALAGELDLREDGRYVWTLPELPQAAVIIVGHEGRWRLDGDRLLLDPDAPTMPTLTFRRSGAGDGLRLHSGGTEFRRAPDEHMAEGPGGVG